MGVLLAQHFLADTQGTLVQRTRFFILALGFVKIAKTVQNHGDGWVVPAQDLLENLQRSLVQRLRVGVATLFTDNDRHAMQSERNCPILMPLLSADPQYRAESPLCLREFTIQPQ